MEKVTNNGSMITATEILKRGWSRSMIKSILGEPDQIKSLGQGRIVHKYTHDRVMAAETRPEFLSRICKKESRSERGIQASNMRANQLLEDVENMQVIVQILSLDVVKERAIRQNLDRNIANVHSSNLKLSEPPDAVATRWMVNEIRHGLTSYDRDLDRLCGEVGVRKASIRLKKKVFTAIAEAYPTLADECNRQLALRVTNSIW